MHLWEHRDNRMYGCDQDHDQAFSWCQLFTKIHRFTGSCEYIRVRQQEHCYHGKGVSIVAKMNVEIEVYIPNICTTFLLDLQCIVLRHWTSHRTIKPTSTQEAQRSLTLTLDSYHTDCAFCLLGSCSFAQRQTSFGHASAFGQRLCSPVCLESKLLILR